MITLTYSEHEGPAVDGLGLPLMPMTGITLRAEMDYAEGRWTARADSPMGQLEASAVSMQAAMLMLVGKRLGVDLIEDTAQA